MFSSGSYLQVLTILFFLVKCMLVDNTTFAKYYMLNDTDKEVGLLLTRNLSILISILLLLTQTVFANSKALSRIESAEVFEENQNYAVVVGVDKYSEVTPLNYAASDARLLGEFFESQGYNVTTLIDWEATKKNVLTRLRTVAAVAGSSKEPSGSLVFVYSGHGFRGDGINYLAPSEVDQSRLKETGISIDEISGILEESNVKQRVLFIDACRNDPSKGTSNTHQRFVRDENSEGLAVLYSTGAGELSFEDNSIDAGVFSHYLLKGLQGDAAADDGLVSFNRLSRFVTNKVKNHVLKLHSKEQIPYVSGERSGEFVLARVDSTDKQFSDIQEISKFSQLTVNRQPPGAEVEIVGSRLKYRDGIELNLETVYNIRVSHLGYETFDTKFKPEPGIQTLNIRLQQDDPVTIGDAEVETAEAPRLFLAKPKAAKPKKKLWMVVGGVVAVAIIAGLAGGGGDSSSSSAVGPSVEGDDSGTVSISIQVAGS